MDALDSKGLRLLSLDGGGVRGLASLLILQRIMYHLDSKVGPEVERPLLPCNYFDLIAGTSTGGLIAIMLGSLRMDVDTCISKYLSMAPKIFPEEGFISSSKLGKLFKGVRGKARFEAENLENAVKDMVSGAFESQEQGEDVLFQNEQSEQDPQQCRTFVCATNKDVGKPFRLRNYRSSWEPGTGCTIWQAARATSAAPLYFPPIRFGKPPTNYVDGGLNYNNPVRSLYDEAKHIWSRSHREIKCIISIGTGVPPLKATGDTGKQILESMVAIATDTQRTADEFADEIEHLAEHAKIEYFRLNVDRGLEKMNLEEWKDFDMLTGATSYYLNSHKADLDRCANALLDSNASGNLQDLSFVVLSELPISSHLFFGRVSELTQLRTMLSLRPGETGRQRAILWGLGGFGKTRIALEYLKTYQKDYSAVLWINAATYESAEESFAQAATVLRSRHALQPSLLPVGGKANLRLVHQWLASSKNTDWLMVLDSLDDLESFDCRDLIPQCSHGSIMVTSTLSHTMQVLDFQGLEISGLDLVHGCEMLLSGVGAEAGSDKEVPTRIIRAMGGVPLAIEQARAMIKQGIPVQDFLGHYETQYQKVMAQKPARSAWDYKKNMSIISIFNMLLMRLDKDGDAENLLAFASCFGPRPVSVNLMGQVHQPVGSTVTSHSGVFKERHTSEIAWLNHFGHDRLAFQLATGKLQGLCLLKVKRDGDGKIVNISLHDSISRWRFETLATDSRARWIIAAAYNCSKCLPEDIVDQGSQIKNLPLVRHFCTAIRRYVEPQKLEAPDGEFGHQYGYLMTRFAPLYLNSGYTVEGEYVFCQAIEYQKIQEASSWPKDRRSLLLLKGLAMMFSKNGKMEDAAEATKTLHDASMKLLGLGDQITSWAAAQLPAVKDRKIRYAESEQRAVVASRGEKLSLTSPGRTPDELLETMTQDEPLDRLPGRGPRSTSGYTALTLAASNGDTEGMLLELDHGVDINSRDLNSVTALEAASLSGHAFTVHQLLSYGANVNSGGRLWGTALLAASREGHTAVVDILLKNGADVNFKDETFGTALNVASYRGHIAIVEMLLSNGADVNFKDEKFGTALFAASRNGQAAVAEMLLSNGADVNVKGETFGTALYAASRNGHTAVAEMLLSNGADVNVMDAIYGTALHAASQLSHTAVAEMLLSKGADVNAEGGRSLWLAVANGHRDMVQLLLVNGADVNAVESGFETALQAARSRGRTELVAMLIAAGARDGS